MTDLEAVLRWYLALSVVTIAFAPAVWWLGKGLGAGRHGLLRPVGLVLATAVIWWQAAVLDLPFNRAVTVATILIAGLIIWAVHLRFGQHIVGETAYLAFFELFWFALFIGYVWFRRHNPDIINTEKPMEIALLNSIVRSDAVPAPDPWFAGSTINYYYVGFQQVATLVKATGIPTAIAFNLGLATVFASVGVAAGAIAVRVANLIAWGRIRSFALAGLAALFTLIAGNLETAKQLVQDPGGTINAGWWDGVGWNASRIIYDTGVNGNPEPVQTINEFPAFSFVLGDLHPHVLAYPLLISVMALAAGLAATPATNSRWRLVVTGVLAGTLYATNSWDVPVGLAVVCAAVLLASWPVWRAVIPNLLYVGAGALLAAFPFAVDYTSPVGVESGDLPAWITNLPVIGSILGTVAVVTWRPTSTGELLTVHGIWIAVAVFFVGWSFYTDREHLNVVRSRREALVIAGLVLLAIAIFWAPALALLGVPLAGSLYLTLKDERRPVALVAGIFAFGFALALIPEFFYVQDSFGNRMNTVFKLYFQAWAFFAVGCAAAFGIVLAKATDWLKYATGVALLLAIAVLIPYTPLSASDWMKMGRSARSLDGAAYIASLSPSEYAAIAWIDEHAEDGDVLVESPGCGYQNLAGIPMNRTSAFTGVSTILGWSNHEGQWRRGESPSIYQRMAERTDEANSWLNGNDPSVSANEEPRFLVFGFQETNGATDCASLVPRGERELAALENAGWVVAFDDQATRVFVRETDPLASVAN